MAPPQVISNSSRRRTQIILIVLNCAMLAFGNIGGPLIMRLYYIHGGKKIWLNSWLETVGWPIMIIPLFVSYLRRLRKEGSDAKLILITPRVTMASAAIGILMGLDNYLHTAGIARLPVSTATLIFATQLAFTALFAFFIVNQKFTPYSINAIVLLMAGVGVLAVNSNNDRPKGISKKGYIFGYFMSLATAALYGFTLPLVELTYKKATQPITYTLVMEIQLVMCFFSTAFCTIGMILNHDFQAIAREAKSFELGESLYYIVLICTVLSWQCFFLGSIGVIFCGSSLLSAILTCTFLPITEILSVIFYHELFKAQKGLSLGLCLWGCISYFYGEYKQRKKESREEEYTTINNHQREEVVVEAPFVIAA